VPELGEAGERRLHEVLEGVVRRIREHGLKE
jgi:hypothetical protein